MRNYRHVTRALFGEPWAIREEKLAAMAEVVQARLAGTVFTADEIQQRRGAAADGGMAAARAIRGRRQGSVAVIPVHGVISQRANIITEASGGTSIEKLTASFREAMSSEDVKAIVFDVDSPGGSVYGITELAGEILAARGRKPMVAVANSEAASAAYWIASAADQVVVTPSGMVGSIGVIAIHEDWSRAYDQAGVTPTILKSGKYKGEGSDLEPLSDETREYFQAQLDAYYGMFVDAVAKGRGRPAAEIRSGFGEGRMVMAKEAVKLGMADKVSTLDQVLSQFGTGRSTAPAAAVDLAAPIAAIAEGLREGRPEGAPLRDEPDVREEHDRERLERLWDIAMTTRRPEGVGS